MQRDATCSQYKSVKALLLYWELRDPGLEGVKAEVYKLDQVFANDFCFESEIWEIPCSGVDVERALTSKLFDFKQDANEGDLLILYYGGHAGNQGAGGSCTWHAGVPGYSVEWNNIAQLLTSNHSDVLFILDCCEASSAVAAFSGGQARHGANWLLASSGINVEANGVSRYDFTQLMIRTLKDMVNDFYENDLPRITSEDIHTALHLNHWEQLLTNGVHVRLNKRACGQIDLTPLISRSGRRPNEDGFKYQIEHLVPKSTILPRKGVLDVLLVPGGDGNPVTSFMAEFDHGNSIWPHDVLCPNLESRRIQYRLLPFQHHWTGQGYGPEQIDDFIFSSEALENSIYNLWRRDPHRPLLFIAYGRGCTVLRKALHQLLQRRGFMTNKPKIGCVLCGTNGQWESTYERLESPNYFPTWRSLADVVLWINRPPRTASAFGGPRPSSQARRSSSSRERDKLYTETGPNAFGVQQAFGAIQDRRANIWDDNLRSRTRSRHRSRSRSRRRSSHGARKHKDARNYDNRRSRSRSRARSRSRGRSGSKDRARHRRAATPPAASIAFDHPYPPIPSIDPPTFEDATRTRPMRSSSANGTLKVRPFSQPQFGGATYTTPLAHLPRPSSSRGQQSLSPGRGRDDAAALRQYSGFFVELNRALAANPRSQRLQLMMNVVDALMAKSANGHTETTGHGACYIWRLHVYH